MKRSGSEASRGGHARSDRPAWDRRATTATLPADRVEAAIVGDAVFLRVVGQGLATQAVGLRQLADRLVQDEDVVRIAADFEHCDGVDSTFIGTMLALAMALDEKADADTRGDEAALVLLNANTHVQDQMRTVGLLGMAPLVRREEEPVEFPCTCCTSVVPSQGMNPKDRLRTVIDAHKRLVHLNDENEERFGPFLRALLAQQQQCEDAARERGELDDDSDDTE